MLEVQIREISDLLSKHEIVCKDRKRLAHSLEISGDILEQWNYQCNIGTIGISDYISNILLSWQTSVGHDATVLHIRNVLRGLGYRSAAESIEDFILGSVTVVETISRKLSLLSLPETSQSDDQETPTDTSTTSTSFSSSPSSSSSFNCLSKSEIRKNTQLLDAYFGRNKFVEATGLFNEILTLIPLLQNYTLMEQEYQQLEFTINCRLLSRKKFADAKQYLQQLHFSIKSNLGDNNEVTIFVKSKLAVCLEELGQLEDSHQYYTEALVGFENTKQLRNFMETEANAKRVADAIAQLCNNKEQS